VQRRICHSLNLIVGFTSLPEQAQQDFAFDVVIRVVWIRMLNVLANSDP